jgi:hypothetical protein
MRARLKFLSPYLLTVGECGFVQGSLFKPKSFGRFRMRDRLRTGVLENKGVVQG